jgi:hypothetical protein
VLGWSQATDEELTTTLVNIEAALNSRPITQDTEDTLTPAHFLCVERLTVLPSGTEPEMERNLTKAHQRTQKMADDFWKCWEKENFLRLRNFHKSLSQIKGQARFEPETSSFSKRIAARHIRKKAQVEELKVGTDEAKRTAVLRGADRSVLVRPIQLVTPWRLTRVERMWRITETEYISDQKRRLCICE